MEDSSLFLQWAVSTMQHHDPGVLVDNGGDIPSLQALREAAAVVVEPTVLAEATKSCRSSGGGGEIGCVSWSMSPNSGGMSSAHGGILPMSWNFGAVSARPSSSGGGTLAPVASPVPELVCGSQTARSTAGTGSASAADAKGHIMAERKRREKINQRFIELSAIIPGLKKMDKATILTEALRHVKELQERVKSLEAAARTSNAAHAVVLSKKASVVALGATTMGAPRSARSFSLPARSALPEIEAKLSENNVMVRIHCENGKGLVVRVLAEAEELHLRIVNSNVMPFTASTVIITIMAKVHDGFMVKADEIIGSLNSVLHQHSSNNNIDN
ncbi:transcription factor bHLH19-like [Lolium rigidum]|uniref:transcription factor bHLH19-like n=1 Tax=Lolium rigidum TaxID=89674 RepID=UPI001F5CAF6B|nr:transcription factor bHLH19-like [Lolium rigidum]